MSLFAPAHTHTLTYRSLVLLYSHLFLLSSLSVSLRPLFALFLSILPSSTRLFLFQSQHQNYIMAGSSARKESKATRRMQRRRWVWITCFTCLLCCFVSFSLCSFESSSSFSVCGSVSSLHFLLFVYLCCLFLTHCSDVFRPQEKEHKKSLLFEMFVSLLLVSPFSTGFGGVLILKEGFEIQKKINLTKQFTFLSCCSEVIISIEPSCKMCREECNHVFHYPFLCFITKLKVHLVIN